MINVYLDRIHEGDQGTLGVLAIPALHWSCYTMELPWRYNKVGLSRIKPGPYDCVLYRSSKFGQVYILQDVEGRSYVLTHYGNWAGDKLKGYITNSEGCILLGYKPAIISNQLAVSNSRSTFDSFMRVLAGQNFKLIIR